MFTCDTGGALNRVVHFYHYDSFAQRDQHRAQSAASQAWQEGYLAHSRPCLLHQESSVFVPAAGVLAAAGAAPVQQYQAPPREAGQLPIYELRQYQVAGAEGGWEGGQACSGSTSASACNASARRCCCLTIVAAALPPHAAI